jgi:hypothetical protein
LTKQVPRSWKYSRNNKRWLLAYSSAVLVKAKDCGVFFTLPLFEC